MNLPENFSFSQNNLQDFVECEFRFFLRYIEHAEWPAVQSEPLLELEEKIEMGDQFHRLIQQYFSGIDPHLLSESIEKPGLSAWWERFLALNMQPIHTVGFSEKLISVPFHGSRLVAKYDLLTIEDGQVHIFDWKTSDFQPFRQTLIKRMQSRIYPAVLLLQSEFPDAIPVHSPSEVEMTYWYPAFPDAPISFKYSKNQFEEDIHILNSTIETIVTMKESQFMKTENQKKCELCRYRSYCERGISARIRTISDDEISSDDPFEMDFDAL